MSSNTPVLSLSSRFLKNLWRRPLRLHPSSVQRIYVGSPYYILPHIRICTHTDTEREREHSSPASPRNCKLSSRLRGFHDYTRKKPPVYTSKLYTLEKRKKEREREEIIDTRTEKLLDISPADLNPICPLWSRAHRKKKRYSPPARAQRTVYTYGLQCVKAPAANCSLSSPSHIVAPATIIIRIYIECERERRQHRRNSSGSDWPLIIVLSLLSPRVHMYSIYIYIRSSLGPRVLRERRRARGLVPSSTDRSSPEAVPIILEKLSLCFLSHIAFGECEGFSVIFQDLPT